ncbi:MAG TPA: AAA family ATPase [Candidatus Limnocylindrales bacterium]|jgi:DNA-binding SARP family transcriptional activator/tetratricopeptide (TPR) repeat protein
MPLDIRVLGPLEVLVDGSPLRVDTRKALAMMALLAVEGRPYAREELAAIFWPESDDESARGAFRRTLSVLRSALGERWLRVDRATVALAIDDDVTLDLARLDAAAARGDGAGLAEAAALARGPFLAGFSLRDSPDFDDWRATRAVSVERRVVDVLERLTLAAEASGDVATAAEAASRLVELDPLDEPARRRLMAILARSGDRAGAIRLYRATVATLERELGVTPLAATTDLYEAIRDERLGPPAMQERQSEAAAAAGAPADPPVLPAAQLPMIGRRRELAALTEAFGASTPNGRVAAVTGEAGIGKSRLVDALLAAGAADGAVVLAAHTFPAEGSIAYAPIVELLRVGFAHPGAGAALAGLAPATLAEVERLVPLPDGVAAGIRALVPADSPASRARLLEAIATVLVALVLGPLPGIIAVEDLQWADDASREALLYLGRRLAGRSALLVFTWRPEDVDAAGAAFADAVEALPGVAVIELERLDDVVVGALVDAAVAAGLPAWDAASLAEESEGLPLYVVEALLAGPGLEGTAPPRGVRALLRERLASVSETASQVLAAAAVIGRSFDFGTVRVASGRAEDETVAALEELVRRGIVREVASGGDLAFDFGHARLRDAAYDGTGLARRRLLHRRVADVLRADVAGRDDPGRLAKIAGHERAGGRDLAAADAYREAGLGSRRMFANREALGHLETALALGHPDVAGLQTTIAEARMALGDYAGAIVALEAAAAVALEEELPGIELRLGRVHARRGDVGSAASHLDAALAGADDTLRPAALVERGAVALRAGDLDGAAVLAAQALAAARGAPDDGPTTGAANRLLGLVALRRGDLDDARVALERALAASSAEHGADPGAVIAARNGLALVEAAAGDRQASIALLEDALVECRRTGETHLEAAVENNLADQLHAAGRTEEAIEHLKRAVTLFADVGGRPGELEPEIWKLVSW